MADDHKTVFISYRRSVASYIARAIFMDLRANGYDVFMDVESIDSGQFDRIILNQIEARAHFLVILAPGTVERCAEPGDWLRREIEYAIDKRRNIVPIMVSGFSFTGAEKHLTGTLADLPHYNGLPVYHEYFDEAMTRLRTRYLKQPVYGTIKPAPMSDQPEVQRKVAETEARPQPTKQELTAEDYFNRGLNKRNSGNFDEAIADLDVAIHLNPQYAEAYLSRGVIWENLGKREKTIADCSKAIQLNPRFVAPYLIRGNAHQAQGNFDEAIKDYTEAIRLSPKNPVSYKTRGNCLYQKGKLAEAIADYEQYLSLGGGKQNGDQAEVKRLVKDLQQRSGNIKLAPAKQELGAEQYYMRALLKEGRGYFNEAIDDWNEAIHIEPKHQLSYYHRGRARYVYLHDFDGAIVDYTEALRLDPNDYNAYAGRAGVYETKGDIKAALADYQEYLNLGGGKWNGNQVAVENVIRKLQQQLNS